MGKLKVAFPERVLLKEHCFELLLLYTWSFHSGGEGCKDSPGMEWRLWRSPQRRRLPAKPWNPQLHPWWAQLSGSCLRGTSHWASSIAVFCFSAVYKSSFDAYVRYHSWRPSIPQVISEKESERDSTVIFTIASRTLSVEDKWAPS